MHCELFLPKVISCLLSMRSRLVMSDMTLEIQRVEREEKHNTTQKEKERKREGKEGIQGGGEREGGGGGGACLED